MFFLLFTFSISKVILTHNEERQFVNWMKTHQNIFVGDEYHLRLGIYLTNLRYIQNFNRRDGLTFHLSANKFACYTPSEYRSLLSGKISVTDRRDQNQEKPKKTAKPPTEFDWRKRNVVNRIKDQGQCGAGYVFSTISSAESCNAILTGSLATFSEQNLIDCTFFGHGCDGGHPQDVFNYIIQIQNGQFNSESDYPYEGVKSTCRFDQSKAVGKVNRCIYVISKDENDLKERVAWHGVAVSCIKANNSPFMLYSGGILDDESCDDSQKYDHCVSVVGYGTENEIDYWIVRNSWGSLWGEEGYVRMIRNKGNQCGIASDSFVILNYDP